MDKKVSCAGWRWQEAIPSSCAWLPEYQKGDLAYRVAVFIIWHHLTMFINLFWVDMTPFYKTGKHWRRRLFICVWGFWRSRLISELFYTVGLIYLMPRYFHMLLQGNCWWVYSSFGDALRFDNSDLCDFFLPLQNILLRLPSLVFMFKSATNMV